MPSSRVTKSEADIPFYTKKPNLIAPPLFIQDRSHSLNFQLQRNILSAKRRVLENEMAQLIKDKSSGKSKQVIISSPDQTDDGYEVIRFDDELESKSKSEEHHYLTPIMSKVAMPAQRRVNLSRKSISDTDLLTLNDGSELELTSSGNGTYSGIVDHTFNHHEPEQGFYRVYDDLDRVREWDLIPYVIARKMREEELAKIKENENTTKEPNTTTETKDTKESTSTKTNSSSKRSGGSRISLDSGRGSIISSNMIPSVTAKRIHSDSGSNCSADSGTYNLFDTNIDCRSRSSSLNNGTMKKKKLPPLPPPPPKNLQVSNSTSPPPLPPRLNKNPQSLTNALPSARRKDLQSYFGLLEDEPNQLYSREVIPSVALQELSATLKEDLIMPQPYNIQQRTTPPGRKDLNKFLGIQKETTSSVSSSSSSSSCAMSTTTTNSSSCSTSSSPSSYSHGLLKRLHMSPKSHKQSQKSQTSELPLPSNITTVDELLLKTNCTKSQTTTIPSTIAVERPFVKSHEFVSCRRELDFNIGRTVSPAVASNNHITKETPHQISQENKCVQTSPNSPPKSTKVNRSRRRRSVGVVNRLFNPLAASANSHDNNKNHQSSSGVVKRSRSVRSRAIGKSNDFDNSNIISPSESSCIKIRNTTPIRRRFRSSSARKSLLNSLKLSGAGSEKKSKAKSFDLDLNKSHEENKENNLVDDECYRQNIAEAFRKGLPLIPFPAMNPNKGTMSLSSTPIPLAKGQEKINNNIKPQTTSTKTSKFFVNNNSSSSSCGSGDNEIPPVFDMKSCISPKNSYQRPKPSLESQTSSYYLSMNGTPSCSRTVRALATPARFFHSQNQHHHPPTTTTEVFSERKSTTSSIINKPLFTNEFPSSSHYVHKHQEKADESQLKQHCQSCTCGQMRRRSSSFKQDYVKMSVPNNFTSHTHNNLHDDEYLHNNLRKDYAFRSMNF